MADDTAPKATLEKTGGSEKLASGKVVRYIGDAHRRVLSRADWKGVGSGQGETVWEKKNNFSIPLDDFDADAQAYIETDEALVVVDAPVK